MDKTDEQHVGETLRQMCAVFRQKYNPDMYKGYWAALQDMGRAEFDAAHKHLMKTAKFMPYPSEFYAASRRGWQ
jgi:hypothetical protein